MGDSPRLSDQQRRALDRLSALPLMASFYLAGGTALGDGLPVDFVRYPYPPLEPPGEVFGLGLAGLRDLAAMKLAAISRRGLRRDFWDLREVLRSGLTLRECCEAYRQRFGVREADLYHVLRALTYFADAEKDPVLPAGLDASGWTAIKVFFLAEAPKLLGAGNG
jgi:hypothetical protein